MNKISILNIGYEFVNKHNNEDIERLPEIIQDPEKYQDYSPKRSAEVKENLNKYQISDFHIVLVKDTDSIKKTCLFGLFNKVGLYAGVIAIGLDAEGFRLIYRSFLATIFTKHFA